MVGQIHRPVAQKLEKQRSQRKNRAGRALSLPGGRRNQGYYHCCQLQPRARAQSRSHAIATGRAAALHPGCQARARARSAAPHLSVRSTRPIRWHLRPEERWLCRTLRDHLYSLVARPPPSESAKNVNGKLSFSFGFLPIILFVAWMQNPLLVMKHGPCPALSPVS